MEEMASTIRALWLSVCYTSGVAKVSQEDALKRYKETGEVGDYADPSKDEHTNDNVVFPPGVEAHAVNVAPDKPEDASAEALSEGRPDLRGTG